jgi:hypothetical protein
MRDRGLLGVLVLSRLVAAGIAVAASRSGEVSAVSSDVSAHP